MRIGIISHLKYPIKEPFAGGLEMHTYALADGLIQRGHHVRVFATTDSDECLNVEPMRLSTLDYESYRDSEPNVVYFSEQFVREHHAYTDLMSRLASEDFDIIHNNSLNYIPILMA
ncbi:MAG: glycosyltransferase, partial [Bacteroidota bacterium]